jgi:aspartate aminotransferase
MIFYGIYKLTFRRRYMEFCEKILKVQPSVTLGITSRAKAMLGEGKDVVILAAGEPDFDTPQVVKDAAIKAINSGFTKYTPETGTVTLREAVCRKFKADNGLVYAPDEIVVSNGAKQCLYGIFQVLLNPGDEVLIIHPYWLSYPEMIVLAGGVPVTVKTAAGNGFKARPEDIKAAITNRTKAIVINSPSNPTGAIYGKKELEDIAKVCVAKGLWIISDEIYEKIIFDGKKHFSVAAVSDEVKARTIVVNGVSKSYSMTGWRIGYMAGDKSLIKLAANLQGHATSNPCSISQKAAECALNTDLSVWMEENRMSFEKKRDLVMRLLADQKKVNPFKPEGAFYVYCDISATGIDSLSFAKRLLEEKQVAVIPGEPFGDGSSIRISIATSVDVIEKGIKRIKEWVA